MARVVFFDKSNTGWRCEECSTRGMVEKDGREHICAPAPGTYRVEPAPSMVDHPAHYNVGNIEVIDAIEDWGLGFHLGSTVKYVARAEHKGTLLEDLKKARWYLDRKIQLEEAKQEV